MHHRSDQAKKIKNKAVVNEDPNAKLIRELKEELATLRNRMTGANSLETDDSLYDTSVPPERQVVTYKTQSGEIRTITKAELQDQLEQSERLMAAVTETWEQKLVKTQEIQKEREQALEALGITIERGSVGVHAPKKMPSIVNLDEDPLASECLVCKLTQVVFRRYPDALLRLRPNQARANNGWQRRRLLTSRHSSQRVQHPTSALLL